MSSTSLPETYGTPEAFKKRQQDRNRRKREFSHSKAYKRQREQDRNSRTRVENDIIRDGEDVDLIDVRLEIEAVQCALEDDFDLVSTDIADLRDRLERIEALLTRLVQGVDAPVVNTRALVDYIDS